MNQKSSSKEEVGTATYSFRTATPEEMVNTYKIKLANTPKWKFLSRLQLKRIIKFWESVSPNK